MKSGNTWWRALIALVVVVALPALAMPKVSNAINDWLYGDSKKVVPPLPDLKVQADDNASTAADNEEVELADVHQAGFLEDEADRPGKHEIARAGFDRPIDAPSTEDHLRGNRSQGRPRVPAAPPLLTPPSGSPIPATTPQDSLTKVRAIRDQLASWGAEYILLESLDDGQRFRFCCLMSDADDPQVTFPFESTAPDAAVAAESVISAIQAWRKQRGAIQ